MLPRLVPQESTSLEVQRFLQDLGSSNFRGDVAIDEATLTVASTDNSIWQTIPQAVIAPRCRGCVEELLTVLARDEHRSISLTPRCAGTSTAGQTLTNSIVLDCKKYLHCIHEVDVEAKQVRVGCGVVLQTVNRELASHGLMIGPTVATASRATIGGMIGNDSAGKGSLVYGKMSDCVVELETVLRGGEVWGSKVLQKNELDDIAGSIGDIHTQVRLACDAAQPYFKKHWPNLRRFITGYNLKMAWDGTTFDLNRILCGSEGTLGITTSALLQCVEIPKNQQLLILCFADFDSALRCGAAIAKYRPSAIETVDDLVLQTARDDASWSQVSTLLSSAKDDVGAVLFVEFSGNNAGNIHKALDEVNATYKPLLATIHQDKDEIELAWVFRSRSVGLLSSMKGNHTPVPFVEDCAVPPEQLADFIKAFRSLLKDHDLRSGMFGHVDAGVIHVRPALNMQDAIDRKKVQFVSKQVASLVQSFGGVLWGEHGKGFRSEFGPTVFGAEIWTQMCAVKTAFDPHDQFNPNKVATSSPTAPLASMQQTTRGEKDEHAQKLPVLDGAFKCDGNSECQDASFQTAMCPTYRVTGDPTHSPRGRADVLRHWNVRLGETSIGEKGSFLRRLCNSLGGSDYTHNVREALDGCLGCKACASDCPMHIDIPTMRSQFYNAYYGRYLRPISDIAWLNMERFLPLLSTKVGRCFTSPRISTLFGISDPPKIARETLAAGLKRRGIHTSDPSNISKPYPSVVLLQDSFTSFYRPSIFMAMIDILLSLPLDFAILPLRPCGKALHVRGSLGAFKKVARRNVDWLLPLQESGIPIIGIDPAATLLWRDEYPRMLGVDEPPIRVMLPQEWLIDQDLSSIHAHGSWRLFPHCIEQSLAKESYGQWKHIFESIGIGLTIMKTSCCGMGGIFGHQGKFREQSMRTWDMHWAPLEPDQSNSMTTGFSCHSQAKRGSNISLLHPLEIISSLNHEQQQQKDGDPALP